MRFGAWVSLLSVAWLAGCGESSEARDAGAASDAGARLARDAASSDAGVADAAGPWDGSASDAGAADGGAPDAGAGDASTADAAAGDGGAPDGGGLLGFGEGCLGRGDAACASGICRTFDDPPFCFYTACTVACATDADCDAALASIGAGGPGVEGFCDTRTGLGYCDLDRLQLGDQRCE